jgi:hypothetical protein
MQAKMRRASSRNTLPTQVKFVQRVVRSNQCTPRCCSCSLIARDSGDCLQESAAIQGHSQNHVLGIGYQSHAAGWCTCDPIRGVLERSNFHIFSATHTKDKAANSQPLHNAPGIPSVVMNKPPVEAPATTPRLAAAM